MLLVSAEVCVCVYAGQVFGSIVIRVIDAAPLSVHSRWVTVSRTRTVTPVYAYQSSCLSVQSVL